MNGSDLLHHSVSADPSFVHIESPPEIWRRGSALQVIDDEQSKRFPADPAAFRIRRCAGAS